MMTESEKLRSVAELVGETEQSIDYYSREAKDESNSENVREYYAYKESLYKCMKDALLSKISKL